MSHHHSYCIRWTTLSMSRFFLPFLVMQQCNSHFNSTQTEEKINGKEKFTWGLCGKEYQLKHYYELHLKQKHTINLGLLLFRLCISEALLHLSQFCLTFVTIFVFQMHLLLIQVMFIWNVGICPSVTCTMTATIILSLKLLLH